MAYTKPTRYLMLLAAMCVILLSCDTPQTSKGTPDKTIESAKVTTGDVAKKLGDGVSRILAYLGIAENKLTPPDREATKQEFAGIRDETGKMKQMQGQLDDLTLRLQDAQYQVVDLQGQVTQ